MSTGELSHAIEIMRCGIARLETRVFESTRENYCNAGMDISAFIDRDLTHLYALKQY